MHNGSRYADTMELALRQKTEMASQDREFSGDEVTLRSIEERIETDEQS